MTEVHATIWRTRGLTVVAILAGLAATTSAEAQTSAQRSVRVVEVVTATNDVHDIAQVGARTLLATSGGLVVRRGEQVERTLTTRDGLPGARLRSVSLLEGDSLEEGGRSEGVLVGGIEGAALLRFDDATGEVTVTRPIPLRRVRRAVRFAGAIWAGTYGEGLHRVDGATVTRVDLGPAAARTRVTDLVVVGDELWVATAGAGIFRVNAGGRTVGRISAALADPLVWDLAPLPGGQTLAATLGGLSVVAADGTVDRDARAARMTRHLRVRDVRSTDVTAQGAVLAATFGDGIYRLDANAARPTRFGIDRAAPSSASGTHRLDLRVVRAVDGRILAGHAGGLLGGPDSAPGLRPVSTGGLPSADVTSLAHAFGSLFVGTFDQGLARVRNGRVEPLDRAQSRYRLDGRINDLAVTRSAPDGERLWIATDRGLYWHDGRRFVPVEDEGAPGRVHVTSLHVDDKGALWVTSSRTLSRRQHGRWASFSGDPTFPVVHLHAVTTDRAGRVWVGSLHGLYLFDPRLGTFARDGVASRALPVNWVTAIVPFGEGVAIGTYHGGLSFFDGHRFQIDREGDRGLPAGWVNPHAMRMLDGELFVGTLERGLLVGTPGRWRQLRVADGLPSDDVTDIVPAGDRGAWIATRGGLARVVWGDQ
jgi:ligand-binding sensor domain-containing protein